MNLNKPNNSILVLPSWYPSAVDINSGDFIQRHVEAISLYKNEYVLYVVKDEKGLITTKEKSVVSQKDNYTEEIIYYHPCTTKIKLINKYISQQHYKKVYKKALKKYFATYGLPKNIQVHVAQKAGLMALWVKKKYNIPYILSEHWTIYLEEADIKITDFSFIFQRDTKRIFKGAAIVTVVSAYLGEAIKKLYPFINYKVIPNVVNEKIIDAIPKAPIKNQQHVFVHASTQNYQKNTEAILEAFALLKNEPDILLQLFGPSNDNIIAKIKVLKIEGLVEIMGNVSQEDLFLHIKKAKALILYSHFETFGCVLIEANALGVPVIVSNHPVFKEIITPGVNGLYAGKNNPENLAREIKNLIKYPDQFQSEPIIASTKKYNFSIVGKSFLELFK